MYTQCISKLLAPSQTPSASPSTDPVNMQTIARSAALGRMAPKVASTQSAKVAPSVRGFVARPVAGQPAHASIKALASKSGRRSVQVQALFGTKTAGGFYDYKVKVSLDLASVWSLRKGARGPSWRARL